MQRPLRAYGKALSRGGIQPSPVGNVFGRLPYWQVGPCYENGGPPRLRTVLFRLRGG